MYIKRIFEERKKKKNMNKKRTENNKMKIKICNVELGTSNGKKIYLHIDHFINDFRLFLRGFEGVKKNERNK